MISALAQIAQHVQQAQYNQQLQQQAERQLLFQQAMHEQQQREEQETSSTLDETSLASVRAQVQRLRQSVSAQAERWKNKDPASYLAMTEAASEEARAQLQSLNLLPSVGPQAPEATPLPSNESVASLLDRLQIMQTTRLTTACTV